MLFTGYWLKQAGDRDASLLVFQNGKCEIGSFLHIFEVYINSLEITWPSECTERSPNLFLHKRLAWLWPGNSEMVASGKYKLWAIFQLHQFCEQERKWSEGPYIQVFSASCSAGAGWRPGRLWVHGAPLRLRRLHLSLLVHPHNPSCCTGKNKPPQGDYTLFRSWVGENIMFSESMCPFPWQTQDRSNRI